MERYKEYKLSDLIYKFYIEDTKRGKNCTKECVERKLLALTLCATEVFDNGLGCKKYMFGTFNILVRENSDEYGFVYWTPKASYVSKERGELLHNLYKVIGLSEDGQEIVGPIDYASLAEFCSVNNLTNIGEYKQSFIDWPQVLGLKK